MKLIYSILWFEDQLSEIQSYVDELKQIIISAGFQPNIELKATISSSDITILATKLDNYNPYDLIIFDYDLGANSENGLNIASTLRRKIYTDMVFYSGVRPHELRKMLFDNQVDGVFVVHRPGFIDEIEPILEDHIKKMTDINNMRGVVMSAMSDIDNHIREKIIEVIYQDHREGKVNVLLQKMKERAEARLSKRLEKLRGITSLDDLVLDHGVTEFDLVRIALKSLYEKDSAEEDILKENNLLHKLQQERNRLAHQKDRYTDDGKLHLISNHGEEIEYNMNDFIRLRRELLEVKANLGCE